jgi:hypothetical protein
VLGYISFLGFGKRQTMECESMSKLRIVGQLLSNIVTREAKFSQLVKDYDVLVMKHCFPSSDILEDIGKADPYSSRQSIENYKTIYRLLRVEFSKNQNKLFVIFTLPPRHQLFEPAAGSKNANAARATEFSHWLSTDFLDEEPDNHNIVVWDFRKTVMDSNTNFLKYEFEADHDSPDSHPNKAANNFAGPQLASFLIDSIDNYFAGNKVKQAAKIIFLHHSTGLHLYEYPDLGITGWLDKYNGSHETHHSIFHRWYPSRGNMPINYSRNWHVKSASEAKHS